MSDAADPLATVMERKLTRMRVKHAQTREYMEVNALKGIVKDGAGTSLYDYFSEFGLTQQSVDFVLGTATTNVQAKVREVLRKIEIELKVETMSGVLALVSPEFFDKLIGHAVSVLPTLRRSWREDCFHAAARWYSLAPMFQGSRSPMRLMGWPAMRVSTSRR
jgi:hypothetical protein